MRKQLLVCVEGGRRCNCRNCRSWLLLLQSNNRCRRQLFELERVLLLRRIVLQKAHQDVLVPLNKENVGLAVGVELRLVVKAVDK